MAWTQIHKAGLFASMDWKRFCALWDWDSAAREALEADPELLSRLGS